MYLRIPLLAAALAFATSAMAQQPAPGLGPAPDQQQADPQVQRAQQIQMEIMQIDQQLQASQQKALEVPAVKSQETKIREALLAEIRKIEPEAPKHEKRLEEIQTELSAKAENPEAQQALMTEGRAIATKMQDAQQKALALPEMQEKISAFETLLLAEMRKANPEAKGLLDRREKLLNELQSMMGG